MSQKRIQDYGSPVVAQSLKSLIKSLVTSAILDGNEFIVEGSDRVRVNPGSCVTYQGVIIIEDEPKVLTIVNTSSPVDYTIFYSHTDADISGGVAAILTLDTGILTPANVDGVILGYIRYPGSGVPLAQSHFIQPPILRIGDVSPTRSNVPWRSPIKSFGYMVTAASGGVFSITDTYDTSGSKPEMYVKIRNNSLAIGSTTLTFPFKVSDNPLSLLQVVLATDVNATVTPKFIDSQGSITVLSASALTGEPALLLKSLTIGGDTVQTSNTLVYVQLDISLAVNREVKLQSIGVSEYNLPY